MCVRLLSWRQLIEPTRFERLDVKNRSVKSGQYPRLWLLRSWLLIFVDMSRLGSTIYSTDKECTNRFAFDLCYNLSARALTVTANYRLFKFGILLWNLITLLSPLSLSSRSRWSCLLLPLLLPIPHLYISLALFRCWGKGKTVPAASSPRAAKHTCLWGLTFTAPNFVMFEFVEISILLFTPFTRKHNSHSPLHLASLPPLLPLTSPLQ